MKWKPDWPQAQENFCKWWRGEGLALDLKSPRREPLEPIAKPPEPDLGTRWLDAGYRRRLAEYNMTRTRYFREAFPLFDTYLGPGSLGTILGSEPGFSEETVWYNPCIQDPESAGEIVFKEEGNRWWRVHLDRIEEGLRHADGRYLVGLPDLVENLDTLAALRGTSETLTDLLDRPDWVHQKLAEINRAYFKVFDRMYDLVKDEQGGNVFSAYNLWGPGKTAKLQCDISCMLSRDMFDRFIVEPLTEQCRWLDFSMYHLDGEHALPHLDSLLAIEPLKAIEWTPVGASGKIAGMPGGGSPAWYDLYRRIKAAGKSVQAVNLNPDEIVPLLDAVGPEGMYLLAWAPDEAAGETILRGIERFV